MPTLGAATSKEQIEREALKLRGKANGNTMWWHHLCTKMSGGMVTRIGKEVTIDHLDEWIERASILLDEMSGFRAELLKSQKP